MNNKRLFQEDDDLEKEFQKIRTKAFMIAPDKVEEFLAQRGKHNSDKIMERFYAHKPAPGVKTPLK